MDSAIEPAPYMPTTRKSVQMMMTRKPSQIASMASCLSRSGVNQFPPPNITHTATPEPV